MPTKNTTPPVVPPHTHIDNSARHYSELARITTGLLVGVLALMTFLLTAGLQHPQPLFSWFIYACLIILPLNLLLFTIGHSVQQAVNAKPAESHASVKSSWNGLRIVRLLQQLLFAVSIIAVGGLALVSAHIFFAPVASSSAAQQQSTQAQ